jgi:16S rRNA processing protein RimM
LFATGANDVMVVKGERRRLIPFVLDEVVKRVDRESGTIQVDWDPDF